MTEVIFHKEELSQSSLISKTYNELFNPKISSNENTCNTFNEDDKESKGFTDGFIFLVSRNLSVQSIITYVFQWTINILKQNLIHFLDFYNDNEKEVKYRNEDWMEYFLCLNGDIH